MTPEQFIKYIKAKSSCCVWEGSVGKNGYGTVCINGKTMSTHRLAYMLTKGDIPAGMDVCHTCDNRLCINPDHLFLGTRSANMRDAVAKGRIDGRSFTQEELNAIRELHKLGLSFRQIARAYNTNHKIISRVVRDYTFQCRREAC